MLIRFKVTVLSQMISEDVESGKITVSSPEKSVEIIARDVSDELSMYADTFCSRISGKDDHSSVPEALIRMYKKKVAKSTDSDNPDDIMDQVMYDDFMESLQDFVEAECQRKESRGAGKDGTPDVIKSVRVKIKEISVRSEE